MYALTPRFTPSAAGTYHWIASYTGVSNNSTFPTACGAGGETLTVSAASPTMTTSASPPTVSLPSPPPVFDDATLSGATSSAGGSITFTLYSGACPGSLVFTSSQVSVSGNGMYASTPGFTPSAAGTYHWIASYTGDSNNSPFTTACGADGETLTVNAASPTMTTSASPPTVSLPSP